ncbi:MAG: hypothetical protein MUC50_24395, partial [Myxococcota bacterium]|nr:hypothetical protein [Myxococcota bacterium]
MSSSRFPLLACLVLAISACSSQPVPLLPDAEIFDSISDGQAVDQPSDSESLSDGPGVETITPTEQDPATATTTPGEDTDTVVTTTDTPSDTVQYCPYLCQDDIGKNTCSALGEHWVRNAGYLCENTAQTCCQALGQP